MMENFKSALGITNKIVRYARGGEKEKRYFGLNHGNAKLYDFLTSIGLHPAKSKTIRSVIVPDKYFADFLRGEFDGDGTFYTFWDKRWPKSFCYKMAFASASMKFIVWLKNRLTALCNVRGYLHPGNGVINLEYVKGDTRKLAAFMYYRPGLLHLSRKRDKLMRALEFDTSLKIKPR